MPLPQVGNCQYTKISSAGTSTLNPGQAGVPGQGAQGTLPTTFGVLYGVDQVAAGTSFAFTALDLIPPSGLGTNTATLTNTLLNGTGSAGQSFVAGVSGLGIRYKGALVIVTSGTPGVINALWD